MEKYKILVYNKVRTNLDPERYEIIGDLQEGINPDAIICRSQKISAIPESVDAIARAGAGVDNIPVNSCNEKGIAVFNTPGANANAVKEIVVSAIIMAARNILPAMDWLNYELKHFAYIDIEDHIKKNKSQFQGREISGKDVFVIGLGNIGILVARALSDLGMKVYGFDPYLTPAKATLLPSNIKLLHTLEEGLCHADFVTVHAELNPQTRNLLNERNLQVIKKGAHILNFARAEIIDQVYLANSLMDKIGYYISDFISESFCKKPHPKAIFLPHQGATTLESEERCAQMAISQLIDFLENGTIINSVNFPPISMPWHMATHCRLCIPNMNKSGILGIINDTIGAYGINIASQANNSQNNMAYTLIDMEDEPSEGLLHDLCQIDGVLKIRIISH